jgi:hypothetical protein
MGTSGDFGHNAAEGGMFADLAEDHRGTDLARPLRRKRHDRRRCFVATRLYTQNARQSIPAARIAGLALPH